MPHQDLIQLIEFTGKDPSRLIFEDELTGIYNRRFLLHYFQASVTWEKLESTPISLLMMDLDHFKQVNDTCGHQIGDQALVWIAELLRKVVGEDGFLIRYGGDEFMVLLQQCDKQQAVEIGHKILKRVGAEPFGLDGVVLNTPLTVSVGVATAPDDAQNSKSLIKQADVALYQAKKTGRGRLVNAGDVIEEAVFEKIAINQIDEAKIVGREKQFARINEALGRFSQKRNQFLIIEGSPGLGKSEFLDTIWHNLERFTAWRVRVNGDSHEMLRPYYLITTILLGLFNQQKDKGAKVLASLSPDERAYLSQVIPQLKADAEISEKKNEKENRRGIFLSLGKLLIRSIGKIPALLFLDNLHYADEASLLLLRYALQQDSVSLFLCSTATDSREPDSYDQKVPLDRFYADYHEELYIERLMLTPLAPDHIGKHIRRIFPNAQLPENYSEQLAHITDGNPLFLNEILRQLVFEHKITLTGNQWVLEPLEKNRLPQSLEEIITEKLSTFDDDNRQILEHVSAFGGDVSLSMLIGSSQQTEPKVLEFIDQAAEKGLLNSDFNSNDHTVRFLSKQISDIAYGNIAKDRRQELHGQIGAYQENLYNTGAISSAAALNYHFKRSSADKKAQAYGKLQANYSENAYNAREALLYTVDTSEEIEIKREPLAAEDLAFLPKIIRDFIVSIRNLRLYPTGSKSVTKSLQQLKHRIDRVLKNVETVNIIISQQSILVNGTRLDVTEFRLIAETFIQLLNRLELKGISLHRGLAGRELEAIITAFAKMKQKTFPDRYWERFVSDNQLTNIDLRQVRYAMKVKAADLSLGSDGGGGEKSQDALKLEDLTAELSRDEMKALPDILRGFVGAYKAIKLYPLKSKSVSNAVNWLFDKLQRFLIRQRALTFSRAGDALLINGGKLETTDIPEFKGIASGFGAVLNEIGIESLTFLERFSIHQLETFIGALNRPDPGELDGNFWRVFARDNGISDILFNQQMVEIQVAQRGVASLTGLKTSEPTMRVLKASSDEPISPELYEQFLKELPDRINDLFLEGRPAMIEEAIHKLLLGMHGRETAVRHKVIQLCQDMLDRVTAAHQYDLASILATPLLYAFSQEKESEIAVDMISVLSRLVTIFIQFVEYSPASQILGHLQKRYREHSERNDPQAKIIAKSLKKLLEPGTMDLLVQDLISGDPVRQRNAALLLGNFGQAAMPVLINIIKQEDSYRARQIAAMLLEKLGPKGIEHLKYLLVLEISAEERLRIVSVIDKLTSDLKSEFMHLLADDNLKVREAAYRLVERLSDRQTIDYLMDLAKGDDLTLAEGAIKCLSKLKPPNIEEVLITILNSSKSESMQIACCRALGQIAKSTSIGTLCKFIDPKKFLFFRKKRSSQVRAAAAFALGQIRHPKAVKKLAHFANDRDTRVREVARNAAAANQAK